MLAADLEQLIDGDQLLLVLGIVGHYHAAQVRASLQKIGCEHGPRRGVPVHTLKMRGKFDQPRPALFREVGHLRDTRQGTEDVGLLGIHPTEHGQRILLGCAVFGELRNAHNADAAEFCIEGDKGEKIADFATLEEVAQIEKRHAETFKRRANTCQSKMTAGENDLVAIGNTFRPQRFNILADRRGFRVCIRRYDHADAANVPAVGTPRTANPNTFHGIGEA